MTAEEFRALVYELHSGLVQSLVRCLKGPKKVSAENLSVCSGYLRHFGMLQGPLDKKQTKQLKDIERAYVEALAAALKVDKPSAGVLAEVRRYCEACGVTKDSGAAADLSAAALPFNRQH